MSKNSLNPNNHLRGINIYKDRSGRAVYYDPLTKIGYLIAPQNVKLYNFYSKRFVAAVIVLILLYNFTIGGYTIDFMTSGAAALATFMIMEILFRAHYLKSLKIVPNFQPSAKEDLFTRMTKDTAKGMIIFKAILYIALAVLLILLAYTENYSAAEWFFCGLLSVAAAAVGIIYTIGAFKK